VTFAPTHRTTRALTFHVPNGTGPGGEYDEQDDIVLPATTEVVVDQRRRRFHLNGTEVVLVVIEAGTGAWTLANGSAIELLGGRQ
jgi:hypothetical protein